MNKPPVTKQAARKAPTKQVPVKKAPAKAAPRKITQLDIRNAEVEITLLNRTNAILQDTLAVARDLRGIMEERVKIKQLRSGLEALARSQGPR